MAKISNSFIKFLSVKYFEIENADFELSKTEIIDQYKEETYVKLKELFPSEAREDNDEIIEFKLKSGFVAEETENGFKFVKNDIPTYETEVLKYYPCAKNEEDKKLSKQNNFLKRLCVEGNLECLNNVRTANDGILVALTKDNSNFVEAKINSDSYFPSTKYVCGYYKEILNIDFSDVSNLNTKRAYEHLIRLIDYENSTNVWRFNRAAFKKIIEYIGNPENNFYNDLANGDVNLPDKIMRQAGKRILSLCSKVCKYLGEYIIGEAHNKYYIYDWYVAHVLPFYLDAYSVEFEIVIKDKKYINFDRKQAMKGCLLTHHTMNHYNISYAEFHYLMSELHKCLEQDISKSQLDHIMWYCYRNYLK